MMYFIDKPIIYASVNDKGSKMNEWISTYTYVLIPDELSRDAFIEGVRMKVAMLDKEYPRTKPLCVISFGDYETYLEVIAGNNQTVCIVHIHIVLGEFQFSKKPQLDKKGGVR